MIVNCDFCDKSFDKNISQINKTKNNYCSRSCAAKINNKKYPKRQKSVIRRHCAFCKKELCKNNKKYCSIKCMSDKKYTDNIKRWKNKNDIGYTGVGTIKSFIRRFILEKYNNKCCRCGWNKLNNKTGRCPLEIHHIDGNYRNNKEENLELLCPNCHSLTNSYKALNKGNGRENRKS